MVVKDSYNWPQIDGTLQLNVIVVEYLNHNIGINFNLNLCATLCYHILVSSNFNSWELTYKLSAPKQHMLILFKSKAKVTCQINLASDLKYFSTVKLNQRLILTITHNNFWRTLSATGTQLYTPSLKRRGYWPWFSRSSTLMSEHQWRYIRNIYQFIAQTIRRNNGPQANNNTSSSLM